MDAVLALLIGLANSIPESNSNDHQLSAIVSCRPPSTLTSPISQHSVSNFHFSEYPLAVFSATHLEKLHARDELLPSWSQFSLPTQGKYIPLSVLNHSTQSPCQRQSKLSTQIITQPLQHSKLDSPQRQAISLTYTAQVGAHHARSAAVLSKQNLFGIIRARPASSKLCFRTRNRSRRRHNLDGSSQSSNRSRSCITDWSRWLKICNGWADPGHGNQLLAGESWQPLGAAK